MITKREMIIFEAGRLVGIGKTIPEAVRQAGEYVNGIEGFSSFLERNIHTLERYISQLEKGS